MRITQTQISLSYPLFSQFLTVNRDHSKAVGKQPAMHNQSALLKLLFWVSLALAFLLTHGKETTSRCIGSAPSIKQTQVGKGKFKVEVRNNCGTCPMIDIHVKCGEFPQSLANPKLFRVLKFDDCVVNSGLPLPPLQAFSFNYTHTAMFPLYPLTWYFQCE